MLQLDTQANVIQALEAGRADAAAVDLSTVWWLAKRQPDKYADCRHSAGTRCSTRAALRQSDLDWLQFVNTTFNVAMFGHQNEIFDKAVEDFFGLKPPRAAVRPAEVLRHRRAAAVAARRGSAGAA